MPSRTTKIRGWLSRLLALLKGRVNRLFVLLSWRVPLAISIVVLVALVVVASFTPSDTMISFQGRTDVMTIGVSASDPASFGLSQALNTTDGRCLSDVLIRPAVGTEVTYQADRSGLLSVFVRSGVLLTDTQSPPHPISNLELLVSATGGCASGKDVRLPANGALRIGSIFRVVTSDDHRLPALRDGMLRVHGRSLRRLAGIPLSWGPFAEASLYQAGELVVPMGSVVEPALASDGLATDWRGYADAPITSDPSSGILVSAATDAKAVPVLLPKPYAGTARGQCAGVQWEPGSSRPECVTLGLGRKLTLDPSLRLLYGLIVALGAFGGAMAVGEKIYGLLVRRADGIEKA